MKDVACDRISCSCQESVSFACTESPGAAVQLGATLTASHSQPGASDLLSGPCPLQGP